VPLDEAGIDGIVVAFEAAQRALAAAFRVIEIHAVPPQPPPQTQVGVAGQLGGAAAGPLGQAAFGQGLQPPGDALDHPDSTHLEPRTPSDCQLLC
jgi:hypothetical protein